MSFGFAIFCAAAGLLGVVGLFLSHWRERRQAVRTHDWMSADDRASVLQFHAIKDQQHAKPKAGYTRNR